MIKKLSILILSMIMIISCSKNNPNNPTEGGNGDGGTTPELPTTSVNFDEVFLKFETDDKTVPTFTFFKDDGKAEEYDPMTGPTGNIIDYKRSWTADNDGTNVCYIYNAPDGESKNGVPGTPGSAIGLTKLKIYVYKGVNPFKTKNDNEIEKQFYFYRYVGNAMYDLDNFLIAVDTKTGLVFPYAVPEKWKNMLLSWGPDGWISAENGKTLSFPSNDPTFGQADPISTEVTFEAHKFWQYDPIGQVNDDGSVTLEQFYIDAQGKSDYKPRYTGTSPYKDIK